MEGFIQASKPLPVVALYPPPSLPRDFRPQSAGHKKTRFEPTDRPQRDQGKSSLYLINIACLCLVGLQPYV